jgi:hypothetical protein
MYGCSYDKCTACSQIIQDAFLSDPHFMLRACNQPNYLEDLSGLTEMNKNINFDDVQSFGSDDFDME